MGFADSFVEEVRHTADIVQVISEHVSLKKVGASWVGLCPFHNEKTPSFNVRNSPAVFHCFGCGEGGDIFKFVMTYESCSFPEALELLARRFGLEVPERDHRAGPERQRREQMLAALEAAAEHYARNLASAAGAKARDYLLGRGFEKKTLQRLQFGAALDEWEDLLRSLSSRFAPEVLLNAGLAVPGKSARKPYDRFRNRAVFPILDELGRVVGFGARSLDGSEPKYLNSPETPVYQKSRLLYGLSWAKDAIRRESRVVLMEGYLDVARALEAGVGGAVATCGTALTPGHARVLRRFTERILVNFDEDEAGRKAAYKSFENLAGEGLQVHVVRLPDGHDPDSFIKEFGDAAYQKRLAAAPPFMEWLIQRARDRHDTDTPPGKAAFLRYVLPALRRVDNAVERAGWLTEACARGGIDRAAAEQELRRGGKHSEKAAVPPAAARSRRRHRTLPAERWLLSLLAAGASGLPEALEELDEEDVRPLASAELLLAAKALLRRGVPLETAVLAAELKDEELRQTLTEMAVRPVPTGDAAPLDCVKEIKSWPLKVRMAAIDRQLELAGPEAPIALVTEKLELRRRIDKLKWGQQNTS